MSERVKDITVPSTYGRKHEVTVVRMLTLRVRMRLISVRIRLWDCCATRPPIDASD
jgi:hypothetical protein